jgi:carboxylesterase type B
LLPFNPDRPYDQNGPAPLQAGDTSWLEADNRLSEDCLNLNVWAPKDAGEEPLPVIVYIFGGGFELSANTQTTSNASSLAATGRAIGVSLNYRLGPFGWLSLSQYGGVFADATNLGLQDIITALKWVQENIARFGGDPQNVTVLADTPLRVLASGCHRDVDILFSTATNEADWWVINATEKFDPGSIDNLVDELVVKSRIPRSRARSIVAAYDVNGRAPVEVRGALFTDYFFTLPAARAALAHAAAGGNAHLVTVGPVEGAPAVHGTEMYGIVGRQRPGFSDEQASRDTFGCEAASPPSAPIWTSGALPANVRTWRMHDAANVQGFD